MYEARQASQPESMKDWMIRFRDEPRVRHIITAVGEAEEGLNASELKVKLQMRAIRLNEGGVAVSISQEGLEELGDRLIEQGVFERSQRGNYIVSPQVRPYLPLLTEQTPLD